jgi:hypothetical protein
MARAGEYDTLLGVEAAVGPLADFDDDYDFEPYGAPGPDEASWFTVTGAGRTDTRSEREVLEMLGRLLGR